MDKNCELLESGERNDLNTIKQLIGVEKVDINFRDFQNHSALHHAAKEEHLNIVKYIVDKGDS